MYCYSGYQVFLVNLFYLALLVMITFIQVNRSSYRAFKKLQYSFTFQIAVHLFFIRTDNERNHERGNINSVLRNRKKKAEQKV